MRVQPLRFSHSHLNGILFVCSRPKRQCLFEVTLISKQVLDNNKWGRQAEITRKSFCSPFVFYCWHTITNKFIVCTSSPSERLAGILLWASYRPEVLWIHDTSIVLFFYCILLLLNTSTPTYILNTSTFYWIHLHRYSTAIPYFSTVFKEINPSAISIVRTNMLLMILFLFIF